MRTRIVIRGLERERQTEYPISVIREAIVNAIVHRDYFSHDSVQISMYADRIEITSPGSLPKGLTMDKLGTLSVKRNPLTYRILRDVKFMEGIGTGIPRMYSEMRKHNLPDPKFEDLGNFFRVTLQNRLASKRKIIESASDLSPRQKRALAYLQKNKVITSKTYAQLNGVSIPTAVGDLNEMIHFGFLKKHALWTCYGLLSSY